MLARSEDRLKSLEGEYLNAKGYPCDVSNVDELNAGLDFIRNESGHPSVVVHNAVGGGFGHFLEIDPIVLEQNFQTNTMALLHSGRAIAPEMISNGEGSIIMFAGFASTNAAQRVLAKSVARDLGPKGVHVGYVAIDAVINLERTRKRMTDKEDSFFCKPKDIAEECYYIAHQPKSVSSFNSIIRPFGEQWSIS